MHTKTLGSQHYLKCWLKRKDTIHLTFTNFSWSSHNSQILHYLWKTLYFMELSAWSGAFHLTITLEGPRTLALTFNGVRSADRNHTTHEQVQSATCESYKHFCSDRQCEINWRALGKNVLLVLWNNKILLFHKTRRTFLPRALQFLLWRIWVK